jgi:hypothetical protein
MSAKGNGGTYHYYACSGRQKLGRKGRDGERLPKDKLEARHVMEPTELGSNRSARLSGGRMSLDDAE